MSGSGRGRNLGLLRRGSKLGGIPEDQAVSFQIPERFQQPQPTESQPLTSRIQGTIETLNLFPGIVLAAMATHYDNLVTKLQGGDVAEMGVICDTGPVTKWLKGFKGLRGNCSGELPITPEEIEEIVMQIVDSCAARQGIQEMPLTLAMTQIQVTFTGRMDKEQKAKLEKYIVEMNGNVLPKMSPTTTHVISTSALTRKTRTARFQRIPVLLPKWVEAAWDESYMDAYVHAKSLEQDYLAPLFHNVQFAVSKGVGGFSKYVRDALTKNGGNEIECSDLQEGDLLICRHQQEEEYELAKRKRVYSATPAWPVYCAFEAVLHDIALYQVKAPDPDYLIALDQTQDDIRRKIDPNAAVAAGSRYGPVGSKSKPQDKHGW